MKEKKYPIDGYAPGDYHNRCSTCDRSFFGDKRAIQCEPCAVESLRELLRPYDQHSGSAVWVKATSRLPGWDKLVDWKFSGKEPTAKETVRFLFNAANLDQWEWLDETGQSNKPTQWVKDALQWAKEAIECASEHLQCPEPWVETWGNHYMNAMHAIQEAQREIESPSKEGNKESMDWIDVNDRLPVLETKVIVLRLNEYSKKNDVLMAYLHDSGDGGRSHGRLGESKWLYGHYWSLPAIVEFKTITHWLPLPVTPQYNQQKEGKK